MSKRPPRIALMLDLQWPYKRHAGVFAGTQKYAEEQGWHSIIDEFAHETLAGSRTKNAAYDGIIARASHLLVKRAARAGVPVVNVWASSPSYDKLPGVFPDYSAVGRQCAEHLLARGFRNFATLTPRKSHAQELVVREFVRVVRAAGFQCLMEDIPQNPWRNLETWRRTERLLEQCVQAWQPPLGAYFAHEEIGRMAVQACHRRGLKVPAEIAVVAGQNEEILCEHPRPSLTSMELGFERVGYEAARLLHSLMDGNSAPTDPVLLPPVGLIVRESTDFYAVKDELVAAALAFISSHSHRPIGQDDVSAAVGAETRTLQNRFRKFLGRPVVAEIRRVRIERAKRELTQSDKPLAEIARDVGFGEVMRMYEVFRRELQTTPGRFRKQRRLDSGGEVS